MMAVRDLNRSVKKMLEESNVGSFSSLSLWSGFAEVVMPTGSLFICALVWKR